MSDGVFRIGNEEHVDGSAETRDQMLWGSKLNSTVLGGSGNDTILGDVIDLIGEDGTFETFPHTDNERWFTTTDPATLGGWNAPNGYSIGDAEKYGVEAGDHGQVLELATRKNAKFTYEFDSIPAGEPLLLSFDIALDDHKRKLGNEGVEVLWNGEVVLDFKPTEYFTWQTLTVQLAGGTGDGSNTLQIRGTGKSDYFASVIDNVHLFMNDPEAAGVDWLVGNEGDDFIYGGGDRDWLEGGEGADTLIGGYGSDNAYYANSDAGVNVNLATNANTGGHAEGDILLEVENVHGSDFDDEIIGDANNNRLIGRNGDDKLIGGDGDDTLIGGAGADEIDGGAGKNDRVEYDWSSSGVEVNLTTGEGKNGFAEGDKITNVEHIYGSFHDDIFIGDENDNRILGDIGDDVLDGRGGRDTLIGGLGADTIIGGEGNTDVASYQYADTGVGLSLEDGGFAGEAAGDTFEGIEFVYGSDFEDDITGDSGRNRLVGFDGDDTLDGAGGNDTLLGLNGDDTLIGGAGYDVFLMEEAWGNDTIKDFWAGEGITDRLWFRGLNITKDDLEFQDTDEGVVINAGSLGTLILEGVASAQLNDDDFIF